MGDRVLLIRPDKAGDAIKTIPVLRALVKERPQDNYTVLSSQFNASIFEKEPGLRTFVLPAQWEKISESELISALLECDRGYHRTILLPCDPTLKALELLELLETEYKFSARFNPAGQNETDNIARLVDSSLGTHTLHFWRNEKLAPLITENDRLAIEAQMGKKTNRWIGFSPFAGTEQRTHPITQWERFLQYISRNESSKFVFFGAPWEKDRLEKLATHLHAPDQAIFVYPPNFRALGACLLRLDGLISVDSGPLHYALSLGVPSLGLMSGGDKKRWFPAQGPKDVIVRRGLLNRYPSLSEMLLAYARWRRKQGSIAKKVAPR